MSKPSSLPMWEVNARHAGHPCRVSGCRRSRDTVSPYCWKHRQLGARYGSPTQKAIFPRDYQIERDLVADLITKNLHHPGIASGIEFFRSWMIHASEGTKDVPAKAIFKALTESTIGKSKEGQKVTAQWLLEEAAAVFLFARWNPSKVEEGKPLRYTLARAVMRPSGHLYQYLELSSGRIRKKQVPSSITGAIADHIWGALSLLLANIAQTIENREDQKQQHLRGLLAPITE